MENDYILRMSGIKKSFSGNAVLKGIDFDVKGGEIVSIVGENGAGKSTLMNILFGMPVISSTGGFEGSVDFCGEEVVIDSPQKAIELGIGMVHQEFMLIPAFSIAENVKLNREITSSNILSRVLGKKIETLDFSSMRSDARLALDSVGMGDVDETAKVAGMPVGYMQFVECAREVDKKNARLIVFDEPTAVLTEIESKQLLNTMKQIAAKGIGVVFISHKLEEIMEVSSRIMVMRDGESVAILNKNDTNVQQLAELMVGRTIGGQNNYEERDFSNTPEILSVEDLKVYMPGEQVKGVSFSVKQGEILGIAGLAGHGKIGIANGIMGLFESTGIVKFRGENLPRDSVKAIMEKGINFVSEDRKTTGLILANSIEKNIALPAMRMYKKFMKKILFFTQIDVAAMHAQAEKMIKELEIKCTSPNQKVGSLSGGNQQKVCLAAALTLEPKLLFVSEPTRGIDIGAKQVILDYLKRLNREDNLTIVMTSSELNELRSMCDRIMIVSEGRIIGELKPNANDADFGMMMSGIRVS